MENRNTLCITRREFLFLAGCALLAACEGFENDFIPENIGFDSITWNQGQYIGPRTFNATEWPEIYKWKDLLESAAEKHGFQKRLGAALTWIESRGDRNAYSKGGAVGLLQIMPRDGIAANFVSSNGVPLFHNRPTIKELLDPEFNVNYGFKMLSDLQTREGTLRDALMRYGPANVGYDYPELVFWLKGNVEPATDANRSDISKKSGGNECKVYKFPDDFSKRPELNRVQPQDTVDGTRIGSRGSVSDTWLQLGGNPGKYEVCKIR